MTSFTYYTIAEAAQGLYKEKGSKFIAFAYPVDSEVSIKERIETLKKAYFDAQHHCYAWMLGSDKTHFRAFDDGEPNHSAGDPILGQIKSKKVTNILIVVVRYFGGTKLGVGGLISAYKEAAEDALRNAVIIEKDVIEVLKFTYSYTSTPEVMRMIKEFELSILQQNFDEHCVMHIEMKMRHKNMLLEKVRLLQATGYFIRIIQADDKLCS